MRLTAWSWQSSYRDSRVNQTVKETTRLTKTSILWTTTRLSQSLCYGRLVVHLLISKVFLRELALQSGLLVKETIRGTSGSIEVTHRSITSTEHACNPVGTCCMTGGDVSRSHNRCVSISWPSQWCTERLCGGPKHKHQHHEKHELSSKTHPSDEVTEVTLVASSFRRRVRDRVQSRQRSPTRGCRSEIYKLR
ncbi:hypothetical protein K443DRAFT_206249 [Laccaria amethystina LaAM-08-1]|uniref:Uncharacterized protein n=1 Tax=Laccaria amethystina LaAM-08-1 TaxID=1095629 RepID=A0A0C9WMW6_9AGAR|nr:hypothetical protein K443DRAFT_206249 [Laccaria amethystina LaAM-08-1]